MAVTAIITARGGSTRTPRKNVMDICGLPLVAWSIIQAKCSYLVDSVWLTTDDDEIAAIGERFGARIIRRPVLDNGISARVVIYDAVLKIEAQGYPITSLLSILPTCPLRKPNEFDRMIEAHLANDQCYVTTACPQKETYLYRLLAPYQDRFGTYSLYPHFTAQCVIADKFWNYARLGGGTAILTRDEYAKGVLGQPETDYEIDTQEVDTKKMWTFIGVEEWQTMEIDYPSDAELVRLLMEHYICKGRREAVYYEYQRRDDGTRHTNEGGRDGTR
jgi:hypothetical protein